MNCGDRRCRYAVGMHAPGYTSNLSQLRTRFKSGRAHQVYGILESTSNLGLIDPACDCTQWKRLRHIPEFSPQRQWHAAVNSIRIWHALSLRSPHTRSWQLISTATQILQSIPPAHTFRLPHSHNTVNCKISSLSQSIPVWIHLQHLSNLCYTIPDTHTHFI